MLRALRLAINVICCYFILSLPVVAGMNTAFTPEGRYTFYCNSSSSQAKIVTCYSGCAVFYKYVLGDSITGESVTYENGNTIENLLEEYAAEILFTEEADGVLNYYCYAPSLPYKTELYGATVTMHIATDGKDRVAVGTPLIFGGF